MSILGKLGSMLPDKYRTSLLRYRHASKIRNGTFVSPEPDFATLDTLVGRGDWAIDIGANCGLYTARLSDLVSETGRVFSFEPVPSTFQALTANVWHLQYRNVTLINAAVSDYAGEAAINIPISKSGSKTALDGWASLDKHAVPDALDEPEKVNIYVMPLDSLTFTQSIKLIKMDVEGHDLPSLQGMTRTIKEHSPILIVEVWTHAVLDYLSELGYRWEKLQDSSNYIFRHGSRAL